MAIHNFPAQATMFVGRHREIADLTALLHNSACRLLTLVGPGGIGKTRLALEVAERMPDYPAHGAHFVNFQPVASADIFASTIADTLNIPVSSQEEPQARLVNFLREKEMLLILDNLDHLLDETAGISDLLMNAPQVKILSTSREALKLQEEWLYPVQGLSYPAELDDSDIERYEAVQVFLQTARHLQPGFSITNEKTGVIRICRLAEGIPLAVELAGAWVNVLSCNQIADEMQRNLDFLMASARNVPARHRSMRAVFEHSWHLLNEDERTVFRRLSIFRGGFTFDAAAAIAGAALPLLAALIEKSLVRRMSPDRYDMHELLRQFAEDKLNEESGERETAQNQHKSYYVAFLRELTRHLRAAKEFAALKSIERELENIRVCWDYALEQADIAALRQCVEPLQLFYYVRERPHEGIMIFDQAAQVLRQIQPTRERDVTLGWLLAGQGKCCMRIGRPHRAKDILEESVAILRRCDAPRELGWALDDLGCILHDRGEYQNAADAHYESLALAGAIGDDTLAAWENYNLSYAMRMIGDYAEALHLMQESVVRLGRTGDEDGLALAFVGLGNQLVEHGEYSRAKAFYEQSLAIYKRFDYGNRLASVLEGLGNATFALGDYVKARELLQQSVAIARELDFPRRLVFSLVRLGSVVHAMNDVEEARQLFDEALAISTRLVDARQQALALKGLGHIAFGVGAHSEAYQYYRESLTLNRQIGLRFQTATGFSFLGQAAHAMRNPLEARHCFWEALRIGLEIHLAPALLEAIIGIAGFFSEEGEPARAMELFTLVSGHHASSQTMKDRAIRQLDDLKAQHSSAMAEVARKRGESLELETVAQDLFAELSSQREDDASTSHQALAESLSQRELDVMALIATGLSNREIARRLVISEGTVKWYTSQIYGKLGVQNRAQSIQRAHQLNLLS